MTPSVTESILVFAGRRYAVTAEDILWLVRAVEAEGHDDGRDLDERHVAQTLVNGFAYEFDRCNYPTLTAFVRAYAQPVNARWFPEGDLHKRWAARGKDTAAKAARRRDFHAVRTDFVREAAEAVDRALIEGPVDIAPNCTDYAAPWLDASHKYNPLSDAEPGVNRLWTRAPTWSGYAVFQWQRSV